MVVVSVESLLSEKHKIVGSSEIPIGVDMSRYKTNLTSSSKFTGTFICFVAILILTLFAFTWYYFEIKCEDIPEIENESCSINLVESIPEGLTFNGSYPSHLSTYEAWMTMLKHAEHSVDIVSFYWTLQDDHQNSSWQGENILKELFAVLKRGIKLRIIQNIPTKTFPNKDTENLKREGAEVLNVDMTKFYGNGVLHTKFWVVDGEMFYVGSANTDWRSLAQVKELGVLISSCKSLTTDALKLVHVFQYAATNNILPDSWPHKYRTKYNKDSPLSVKLNGIDSKVYLTSSPKGLCPYRRTTEISAILDIITKAKSFINIAVMDYAPAIVFGTPKMYWSLIDDALRKAAIERKVKVNFLGSIWRHTKPAMLIYLKSLAILNDINHKISIKLFCVPSNDEQALIPHARVNHNKYMITDNAAYISTSNWVGDYFETTAGVSIVLNQTSSKSSKQSIYNELLQVFKRDWSFEHSVDIWDVSSNNYTCT